MKKMIPISDDEAQKKHGISYGHTRAENGELRFRLKKNDGTMYIRTEAPPKGEWQDSHWHEKVMETYIVQKGWMGYAESKDGEPELYICHAGESLTTRPDVIHNVYLPADAVIHTVKHGQAQGEDRIEDERARDFTVRVRQISEKDLLSKGRRVPATGSQQHMEEYSPGYMHFDTLIWQVPAWATAIFAIVLAGMTQLQADSPLVSFFKTSAEKLLAGSALMFGLMLVVLSYALYRFRRHQIATKTYTPTRPYSSPQIALQGIVNIQAIVLLFFALRGFGSPDAILISGALITFLIFTIVPERRLVREGKEQGKERGLPARTGS